MALLHVNPEVGRNRDDYSRMFCNEIRMMMTYVSASILGRDTASRNVKQLLEEYRAKFRAVGGLIPEELVLTQVGDALFEYAKEIGARDEEFFRQRSLFEILSRVQKAQNVVLPANIKEDLFATLSPKMRAHIFDTLNILLKLYAQYAVSKS